MEGINEIKHTNQHSERILELFERINREGRLTVYTVLTDFLAKKRAHGETGFIPIFDAKFPGNYGANQGLINIIKNKKFNIIDDYVNSSRQSLEEAEISAVISILPFTFKKAVYRTEKKIIKGLFKNKEVEETVHAGYETVPVSMHELNPSTSSQESAFKIIIKINGTKTKIFRDPITQRSGGTFDGSLYLPESLAREVFTHIQDNPGLIFDILRSFDPEIMSEIEPFMPQVDKVLVIPEGQIKTALKLDPSNERRVLGINENYVKKV